MEGNKQQRYNKDVVKEDGRVHDAGPVAGGRTLILAA